MFLKIIGLIVVIYFVVVTIPFVFGMCLGAQ